MGVEPRRCRHCNKLFLPSVFCPSQRVCSASECQRRRRVQYHRNKYWSDPEYRQVCRESTQKWRSRNRDYQRRYRQGHPVYVEKNRRAQSGRDRRRRARDLVKNNSAIDLKSLSADVWLVGSGIEGLVKNNIAISEVMFFHTVAPPPSAPG